MKHIAKTLILASAMAAIAGAAQAERSTVTRIVGLDPVTPFFDPIGDLQGSGQLNFSEMLLGALSIANITTTAVSPSTLIETDDTLAVTAPVFTLSGEFDSDTLEFTTRSVRTNGGALMTASGLRPNSKKNPATTGGSLSVTNIKVDLTTQGIYATLTGANGVGTQNNVLVWNYGAIEGPTTFRLGTDDAPVRPFSSVLGANVQYTLSALTITDSAFNLFAQSLGLTDFGKRMVAGITDYGTMNAEITLIPEPSTYLLMGLGLVGLAFASRRASRA